MQTNLRERLSRCRSTAKCVSAGLRALHSNGVKKKKKKKRSSTHLSNWLLLKAPLHLCFKHYIKKTKNVHYDHSSNFNSEMQKKKNHQVSPSERLQYRSLASRWHFGFREETGVRGSKCKEIYTFTLMHHSSQVEIHSILNVNIKSVQRQYCVWSII